MEIGLDHLNELGFEYFANDIEILDHLQSIDNALSNVESLVSDLYSFLALVLPLWIGILIGLVAMKSFWDGASRW